VDQAPTQTLLDNGRIAIAFDDRGRILRFQNHRTGADFLSYPGLEDNWKLLVLGDGYPVYYLLGRDQTPIDVHRDGDRVTYSYRQIRGAAQTYDIDVDFTAALVGDEARFRVRVRNGHDRRIREVWAPILGGFEGFTVDGRSHVVHLAKSRTIARDILHTGLPDCEYLFCVDGETTHYVYPSQQMQWIDLFGADEGLYVSSDDTSLATTVFRLEKYPPEAGAGGSPLAEERHAFPAGTPRWLKILVGRLTTIDPGEEWTSPEAVFWPHAGDWHAAADHYRAWTDGWMVKPERPTWLADYVGWQHIIGKTYLNEVYHTFDQFTEVMIESQRRTGIDVLMLYGHSENGCESADEELSPARNLGGAEGFRRMCDALHARGMKVMIMTHRQSALALDNPAFPHYEPWTIKDRDGRTRTEIWWKTTIESLLHARLEHYEATGPIWARVCPHCDEWWEGCLEELKKLMALGLDGVQLDTIGSEGTFCYATDHGHKPGAGPMDKLAARLAWLRREVRAVNPEFLVGGEELRDWQFQYLDLPYSRYRNNEGYQVFRYTFPETRENVAVGAYSYDQANKAFLLGLGMNVEVWGLKKSVLVCPELADYLGDLNRIRREHRVFLLDGRFRDTLGARVGGGVRYGVHEGANGRAVVLWNDGDEPRTCTVEVDGYRTAVVRAPGCDPALLALPGAVTVAPHRVAAIVAER
jgi:Domain of unknown function (DUF6259)